MRHDRRRPPTWKDGASAGAEDGLKPRAHREDWPWPYARLRSSGQQERQARRPAEARPGQKQPGGAGNRRASGRRLGAGSGLFHRPAGRRRCGRCDLLPARRNSGVGVDGGRRRGDGRGSRRRRPEPALGGASAVGGASADGGASARRLIGRRGRRRAGACHGLARGDSVSRGGGGAAASVPARSASALYWAWVPAAVTC